MDPKNKNALAGLVPLASCGRASDPLQWHNHLRLFHSLQHAHVQKVAPGQQGGRLQGRGRGDVSRECRLRGCSQF